MSFLLNRNHDSLCVFKLKPCLLSWMGKRWIYRLQSKSHWNLWEFLLTLRGRVWYAAGSRDHPKHLQVRCALNVPVSIWVAQQQSDAHWEFWSTRRLPGWRQKAKVLLQAPSSPGHSPGFSITLGFGERTSLSLAWLLDPSQSKGDLALPLQCQSSPPLLPAVWPQSWSGLQPLCVSATSGICAVAAPLPVMRYQP